MKPGLSWPVATGFALAVLLHAECVGAQPATAAAEPLFEAGVTQTREGRYEDALRSFLAAREAGDQSARLHFNLGVVYYRLGRHDEASAAFARAAQDPDTADLAAYNLGLVALAAGDRDAAQRQFRHTAQTARAESLRALGLRALERAGGRSPTLRRGTLSMMRGRDSNVVLPIGSVADVATSESDDLYEARAAWAAPLGIAVPGLGYRLLGLAAEYDRMSAADLSYVEAGLDWRGPFLLGLGGSVLSVGDRGYQRAVEVRATHAVYDVDGVRVTFEGAQSWLNALQPRADDLDGTRLALGASLDVQRSAWLWSTGLRRTINDRRASALSPEQSTVWLRLRWVEGRWAARAWTRYTDGKYPTDRHDRLSEFGADLSLRLLEPLDLIVEATRFENRSSASEFAYASERVYAGLRLRF